jgi:hypothetical protein
VQSCAVLRACHGVWCRELCNNALELVCPKEGVRGGSLYSVNMERIMQDVRYRQLAGVVQGR